MKKNIIIILAMLVLVLNVNVAKAKKVTCDDVMKSDLDINNTKLIKFWAGSDFHNKGNFYLSWRFNKDDGTNVGGNNLQYAAYLLNSSGANESKYVMYCRNPGLPAGNDSNNTYYCDKTIDLKSESSDNSYETRVYNAGIIEILKNGYNENNGYAPWNSANSSLIVNNKNHAIESVSTEVALRIYEMMWKNFSLSINPCDACLANDSDCKAKCKSNQYLWYINRFFVNLMLDNETVKNNIKILNEKTNNALITEKFYTVVTSTNWCWNEGTTKTCDGHGLGVMNRITDLVIKGLEGAINYTEYGAAELSYQGPYTQSVMDKNSQKKEITYILNAKSFNSDNSYIKMNFKCDNCKQFDADFSIFVNGTKIEKNKISSTNLIDYLNGASGEIKVKILFETSSQAYECGNIKYSFSVDYYDETINTEVFSLSSSKCQTAKNCQFFYMLYDYGDDVYDTISLDGDIRLCELDCKDLEKQCNLGNKDACDEWEKKFNSTCIECGASIQNAVCTDKDSDINIIEGTEYDEETCTNKKDTNVLQCIIDNKDEAGNSYQATEIVSNNYCTVWCKEDFHLKLPGNKYTNSGRYFTLQTSITGTKTCYTTAINKDQFKTDYTLANAEIQTAYKQYQSGTTTKSQVEKEINDLENIIKEYNSCSNWNMDYQFEPEVEFWYQESYMNNAINKTLTSNGSVEKGASNTLRCSSDTNDTYNDCETDWTKDNKTEKINLYTCYKENGEIKCGNKDFVVNNTVRMKTSITATGKYVTPTQFYNIYPSGAIISSSTNDIENSSPLVNALPVGLGTKKGIYNYTLKVKNLGEYYDSDELGRVWGDKDSVVSVTLEEQEKNDKCSTGALVDKITINGKDFDDGVYTCGYVVNCPDCPVVCNPSCELPNCPNGKCPVVCNPSCIFDNENINVNFRPVSPDDLNPNDRPLGTNWDPGNISTEVEIKAHVTTQEIEKNSESIYDISFESNDIDADFAMQVTLDSKMISKIRKYNDRYEDSTGYLNNSLECYDHVNNNDNQTYKNVYCYSTFLDELLTDNDTKDNIKITGGERLLYKEDRKNKTQWSSGYWTTWSEVNKNEWTVVTEKELSWYGTGINIGPAWK